MQLNLGRCISLATQFAGRSDYSTSEVSELANLALTEVTSRVYHFPKEAEAVSNVTGTGDERRIALPTDFDGVLGLKYYSSDTDPDSGDNRLGMLSSLGVETDLIGPVDTSLVDSFSSTSGLPQRYAIYAGNVELDPIPSSRGSFFLRYLAKQATLVLSSSTPDLDERWHMGWLYKTEELVNRARGNAVGGDAAERRYVNFMVATPNDRSNRQQTKNQVGLAFKRDV